MDSIGERSVSPVTARRAALLAGILLIAANLRSPLTVVGPLLGTISRHFSLSPTEAGLLNTLPVLGFGAFSPLAPPLSRRLGIERALLAAMIALCGGIVLRSLPSAVCLFGGTILIGAAVAIVNVLLPALVKRRFPGRISSITGLYAATMSMIAAIGSGVAVPLAGVAPGGWRTALGCWAGLALVAAAFWLPQAARGGRPAEVAGAGNMPLRSSLAWLVTAFMGLQSFGFYVMIGWAPTLLVSRGDSPHIAGLQLFVYQVVGLLSSLLSPLVLERTRSQSLLACVCALLCCSGYAGLILLPSLSLLWLMVTGAGAGACLVIALSFMSLRTAGPHQAAGLSAMAQCVGYLFASTGPLIFGFLHQSTGGWLPSMLVLQGSAVILAGVAVAAGRPVQMEPDRTG
ncbi:MAG TPA: MFS transporter [Candidatus Dormibacteraeota bacterium]|nr:MFS transporter [Candidatus Dormibacteraeota bacterium]